MSDLFWFIQDIFRTLAGFALVVGLLYFIYHRSAFRWQYLAKSYARPWGKPLEIKHMQSVVLYGMRAGGNIHRGIVTIGIEKDGVAFKPLWFLAPFHEPLFIPYSDIRGWGQQWYLDDKSVELEFARAPEVKLLMAASEFKWIREFAGNRANITDARSPNNAKPEFFYWFSLIVGLLSLGFGLVVVGSLLGFWDLPVTGRGQ
ncbi:MAG: hypothetical protein AAFN43_06215 [Pseudomonadota bacterium]